MLVEVKVLRVGQFQLFEGGGGCRARCTVSLIRGGGKNIIVDPGGLGESGEILRLLEGEGLTACNVDYVVLTHFHPDHVGNMSLFSNATFVDGVEYFRGDFFTFYTGEFLLTDKIRVISTPGHCSNDDCSVIVEGEAGVVAIVGDLFWHGQDDEPPFIFDQSALLKSREEILRVADFIVPGHEDLFKVNKRST